MSDRGGVAGRQGLIAALVALVMLALLSSCSTEPSPGPQTASSPTWESTQTRVATRDRAASTPSVTHTSAVVPTATRIAEPMSSATPLPAVVPSLSPKALTPAVTLVTPTSQVGQGTYVISDVVVFDGAHGRLYARGRIEEQDKTLVLSATDGGLLTVYDYAGALGLDAVHRWLYVDAAGTELVILNADTGERLGAVELPPQGGYQPRAIPPQADPAQEQILAFRENVVYIADAGSGRMVRTIPFEFARSKDCRTGEGPYPIEWAAFDSSLRILYVSYLSYVCTPWIGLGITSYDLSSGQEIAQGGDYAFEATVADGYLYGSSWHRFGIGYLWAWRNGKPFLRSSDWNSRPRFVVDKARNQLYGEMGGSLAVLNAQTMDLLFAVPWPLEGQLAGLDPVADRLYFVADGRVSLLLISQIQPPVAEKPAVAAVPTSSVDTLIVSPNWPADQTVLGIWGKAQSMDRCYAFAQQGGSLLLSSDGGQIWAQLGAGLPACQQVSCLAMSPDFAQDQTLLAGVAGMGVFRSTDGGQLWRPASIGLHSANVQEFILSPGFAVDDIAFVRVGTGGPYRSTDGGQTWQESGLPVQLPVEQLLLSPGFAHDHIVFARLTSGALYRSRDAGATWQDLGVALQPLALSPEFDQDGTILGAAPDGSALYVSRDGGIHWQHLGSTPDAVPVRWLSLAPLFAKWGVAFAQGRDSGSLYRTGDGGLSWQEVSTQSGGPISIPVGSSMQFLYGSGIEENRPIYLLTTEEDFGTVPPTKRGLLYRSPDGGVTWRLAQLPQAVIATTVTVSPEFASDRLVFVGTADGRVLVVLDNAL